MGHPFGFSVIRPSLLYLHPYARVPHQIPVLDVDGAPRHYEDRFPDAPDTEFTLERHVDTFPDPPTDLVSP